MGHMRRPSPPTCRPSPPTDGLYAELQPVAGQLQEGPSGQGDGEYAYILVQSSFPLTICFITNQSISMIYT